MKLVNNTFKYLLWLLISLITLIVIYVIVEKISSNSIVNDNVTLQSNDDNILVMLSSNGVHTDIVVPKRSQYVNWDTIFPIANTLGKDTALSYVAIGWGDKGFYLNTPEWKDLKFSTAFNAMFGLSTTALHVTYTQPKAQNENNIPFHISPTSYQLLIDYILNATQQSNNKSIYISTDAQYGKNDAFYEAHGSYSLFFTCNSWTNKALKVSNLKATRWCAFDTGLLNAYNDK